MGKQSIGGREPSRVKWENLDTWVRGHVQGFLQQVLIEEVTEFAANVELMPTPVRCTGLAFA